MAPVILTWPPNTPPSRFNVLRRQRYCGALGPCVHTDIKCCCRGIPDCCVDRTTPYPNVLNAQIVAPVDTVCDCMLNEFFGLNIAAGTEFTWEGNTDWSTTPPCEFGGGDLYLRVQCDPVTNGFFLEHQQPQSCTGDLTSYSPRVGWTCEPTIDLYFDDVFMGDCCDVADPSGRVTIHVWEATTFFSSSMSSEEEDITEDVPGDVLNWLNGDS